MEPEDHPHRISLIIPALNEAAAIRQVLDGLPTGVFSEVIVVDNGSTDQTGTIAADRGAKVVREEQRGYGSACLAGIASLHPDCDVVVFMDADASDDPKQARMLVEPIVKGEADLVIGVRCGAQVEKDSLPAHQRLGNTLATGLIQLLFGFRYRDLGPFRAIRRSSLQSLQMRDRTYGWTVEMQVKALQKGMQVREVPVSYRARIGGSSKISGSLKNSLRAGAKILWTIARLKYISR